MPPSLRQCRDASYYLGDTEMGRTVRSIDGHVMDKHGSVDNLRNWMQRNPNARPEFGDLGLKSFFKLDEANIKLCVMNTILQPANYFECFGSHSRAMLWRDFAPDITGTSLGLSNAPLPRGMKDPLEVTGVLCIIEVHNPALVTAFPSDRPFGAREITR